MKLTIRAIAKIAHDPSRDVYVWDDDVAGLGLRLKPSGVRSFMLQYRNTSGASRRITLGKLGPLSPEQARKLAKEKLAEVAKGGDPAEARTAARKAMTVEKLCEDYLSATEKRLVLGKRGEPKKASTLYTDRGRITRHILPLLGNRKVRELTAPDIVKFMRDVMAGKTAADVKTGFRGRAIVQGGRGAATRTVGLLGGILTYAVSEGVIPANPARGVRRPADAEREIRLTKEQYRSLGIALTTADAQGERWQLTAAIRLLALTGCRRGEIERLKWDDVDLARQCLTLSDSKTGKSVRPLGSAAVAVLRVLPRTGQFVLPGLSPASYFTGLPKAWLRILKQANDAAKHDPELADISNLTPHSLRHGFASIANDLGMTEITVAALLGHSTATVTGRYIHHIDAALVSSANRISSTIAALIDGRSQNADVNTLHKGA